MNPRSDLLQAQFRSRQLELADRAAATVIEGWRQMIKAVGGRAAADRWVDDAFRAVMAARRASERNGAAFYVAQRAVELPGEPIFTPITGAPDLTPAQVEESVRTSLRVTGVRQPSEAELTGATRRHAMNGGRDVVDSSIRRDARVQFWYRETDGDPCYWCAMLGSRVNYKADSFDASDIRFSGPGNAKVHDDCACNLRPGYTTGNVLPASVAPLANLWTSQPGPAFGEDPVKAWRRFYEQRRVDSAA